jgi:hypothetical protein
MEKRTKGYLWIGLGIVIVVGMVVVTVIAGAGFWAYQNLAPEVALIDQAKADQQLEEIRATFKNRTPLIVAGDDGHHARLQTEGREATFTGQLTSLHVAAYDHRAGKLMRFSMPFWLLRLAPDGKVSIGDGALDGVHGAEKLTVKDLEALGPGLLVDERKPDGDRVLVWTE